MVCSEMPLGFHDITKKFNRSFMVTIDEKKVDFHYFAKLEFVDISVNKLLKVQETATKKLDECLFLA